MEIYADVLLLVNFVMNSFILWSVAMLCREKCRHLRILAGGLAMALMYVLIMVGLPFSLWLSAIASLTMLSVGIYISFRPKNIRTFLARLFVGYICSFAVGGLGMMVIYRIPEVPWMLLVICIVASYITIKLVAYILENLCLKKQLLCPVTIHIGERAMSFQALVDTGHSLQDPLNKAPVIIAEFDSVKELLPDDIRLMFYENHENDLSDLLTAATGTKFYDRIRMIPFVSLGLANGMLVGFRPDKVDLSGASRKDVVIGIYNRKLSTDGRYQGLIAPELIPY